MHCAAPTRFGTTTYRVTQKHSQAREKSAQPIAISRLEANCGIIGKLTDGSDSMRFIIIILMLALSACKLTVEVPYGGTVASTSGTYLCEVDSPCVIDVYDTYFDETFVAQPSTGYEFKGWRSRDKGLCGGKTVDCALSTANFDEFPELVSILESDEAFYLEPVFERKDGRQVARLEVREPNNTHVIDAEGKVIGSMLLAKRINPDAIFLNAVIQLHFEGIEDAFTLRVEYVSNPNKPWMGAVEAGLVDLFYDVRECDRSGNVYSLPDIDLGSSELRVELEQPKQRATVGPEGFVWIPRPDIPAVFYGRGHMQSIYRGPSDGCKAIPILSSGRYVEMIPTDLKLKLPLAVVL